MTTVAYGRSAVDGERSVVPALARIEGRRLLRHPILVGGLALSVWSFWVNSDTTTEPGEGFFDVSVGQAYFNFMGFAVFPLALATLVVLNLAALRSRRDHTVELYGSLPARAHARTAAGLAATTWAVAVAVVLTVVAYLTLGAGRGLPVDFDGRTAVPNAFELAQGPLLVAALGALGLALASWAPRLVVTWATVFVLFAAEVVLVLWTTSQSSLRWLLPFASSATFTDPSAAFPPGPRAESHLEGFDVTAMGWHVLYLAALAILLGVLALLRYGRDWRLLATGGSALAVLVAAGLLQLV